MNTRSNVMIRFLGSVTFFVFISIFTVNLVYAEEYCEATRPDGTVDIVECCTIGSSTSEPSTDYCTEAAEALNTKEIEALENVVRKMKTKRLAKYLRDNPEVSIQKFTIEGPTAEFGAYCCSCKHFGCCNPANRDGTCPEDYPIRQICSSDDEVFLCTEVD